MSTNLPPAAASAFEFLHALSAAVRTVPSQSESQPRQIAWALDTAASVGTPYLKLLMALAESSTEDGSDPPPAKQRARRLRR
jgi:hypothetical protein